MHIKAIHVLCVAMYIICYQCLLLEVPTYTFIAVPSIGLTLHCASGQEIIHNTTHAGGNSMQLRVIGAWRN